MRTPCVLLRSVLFFVTLLHAHRHQVGKRICVCITYLLGMVGIAPTRWVFGGRRHCCVTCAQRVSRRGGYVGYIGKALEKGYLEDPGSACCTDDMFQIFVRFGQGLCCLLPLFVNRQLPCAHTNSLHGLLPPMHHRNLWCALRGCKVGAGEPR